MPEKLARRMTSLLGLHAPTHPATLPEATIHMRWHARLHREPGDQWRRALTPEMFSGS